MGRFIGRIRRIGGMRRISFRAGVLREDMLKRTSLFILGGFISVSRITMGGCIRHSALSIPSLLNPFHAPTSSYPNPFPFPLKRLFRSVFHHCMFSVIISGNHFMETNSCITTGNEPATFREPLPTSYPFVLLIPNPQVDPFRIRHPNDDETHGSIERSVFLERSSLFQRLSETPVRIASTKCHFIIIESCKSL